MAYHLLCKIPYKYHIIDNKIFKLKWALSTENSFFVQDFYYLAVRTKESAVKHMSPQNMGYWWKYLLLDLERKLIQISSYKNHLKCIVWGEGVQENNGEYKFNYDIS
jgi:hypothetical protein